MQCPICTQALEGGELVMVCVNCHQTLGGTRLDVGSTGEFHVPTPEMIAEAARAEPGERPLATDTCAWCQKSEGEVQKMIGRHGTSLCNECVSLASDIMDAELGNTWR